MKSYYAPNQLRFVGKAWEVRNHLHQLLAHSPQQDMTLIALLNRFTSALNSTPAELQPHPLDKRRHLRLCPSPSL